MNISKLKTGRNFPRWTVLLADTMLLIVGLVVSYWLIQRPFPLFRSPVPLVHLAAGFLPCALMALLIFRMHRGLVRYTNTADIGRAVGATLLGNMLFCFLWALLWPKAFFAAATGVLALSGVNWAIGSLLLVIMRLFIKEVHFAIVQYRTEPKIIAAIYGTDHGAVMIRHALESMPELSARVRAFIDHSRSRLHSTIEQRRVYHIKDLSTLKEAKGITHLVLAKERLDQRDRKVLLERCLRLGIKVLTVPPVDEWLTGKISSRQIKDLQIEDLLQRPPIKIDNDKIGDDLWDKRILITGAAGSIGSEIARQVLRYGPQQVILCDQAESALHELQLELGDSVPQERFIPYIGDVTQVARMEKLFARYQPDIIFHAAAYKHVPMMEHHPAAAIHTNVGGTKTIADLAVQYGARKFVMVSTDKAVNPTNVMGASKRVAELYVQALDAEQPENGTRFITTRFGNVLGSNGSVIPRFRKQLEQGGPLTVTHPEINRYFMTIPEAVQLVLEAGTMGHGGQILVFDMGTPVRIADLARKMIRLGGLEEGKDIEIVYTGLRPGEKLYEELLNDAEKVLPTYHPKISIAQVRCSNYTVINQEVNQLLSRMNECDETTLVLQIKTLVPEFVSNNCVFEALDVQETKSLLYHS
mgnify:CR=1 FL=1|jgi:Predicted nucleoside-diphosphate sugar epimerases